MFKYSNDLLTQDPRFESESFVKSTVDDRIRWVPSCETDTTDCICSVKPTGTWKECIGRCTNIDEKNF